MLPTYREFYPKFEVCPVEGHMKNNIVFFDFDGVIVDTFAFCFKIVDSREFITESEYRQRFEGNVYDATRKFKKPDTKVDDFFLSYTPELMKCDPVEGISKVIEELAKKYTLVIVSSTETSPIDMYLRKVGLRQCFSEILGSDVDRSKVNKINQSLKTHGMDARNSVFITDTLGDMREAEKCQVKCIAVVDGYHDELILKKGNPIAIVKSAEDIIKTVDSYFDNK